MNHTRYPSFCLGDLFYYQKEQQYQQEEQTITEHDLTRQEGKQQDSSSSSYTLVDAIRKVFPLTSPSRDYFIQEIELALTSYQYLSSSLLLSQPQQIHTNKDDVVVRHLQPPLPFTPMAFSSSNSSSYNLLENQIQQVHNILPYLGLGYIQIALSYNTYNVEQTITMLLDGEMDPSTLHPRLQNINIYHCQRWIIIHQVHGWMKIMKHVKFKNVIYNLKIYSRKRKHINWIL